MKNPKIIFTDYSEYEGGLGLSESTTAHKVLFDKLIHGLTVKYPQLKSCQVKALAIEQFLLAEGIEVLCIDSHDGKEYGTSIFTKDTKEKIGFIKTNASVVNSLYDMYSKGIFKKCEKSQS